MNIGDRVGDYEIIAVLGAGGMGQVYKVRNVLSERVEAMKVLLPNLEGDPDLADRFLREIKVQATLNHPNIAKLHTAMRVSNQLVMLMEFVDGVSVAELLERNAMQANQAVATGSQVLDALEYAHAQGVVHRDIKPANIMLTGTAGGPVTVKLMDFGIARARGDQRLTRAGGAVGSLSYMSPEQIKGAEPDPRSDLYSLGVTLYEMVTGKRPFEGSSDYQIMAAHLEHEPAAPIEVAPGVPSALNDIILIAIAKDPAERFQSAHAFRAALGSVYRASEQADALAALAPLLIARPAQPPVRGEAALGETATASQLPPTVMVSHGAAASLSTPVSQMPPTVILGQGASPAQPPVHAQPPLPPQPASVPMPPIAMPPQMHPPQTPQPQNFAPPQGFAPAGQPQNYGQAQNFGQPQGYGQPQNFNPPPKPSSRRGLYMALGSIATLAVLIAAGIEGPKYLHARAGSGDGSTTVTPATAPSTPTTPSAPADSQLTSPASSTSPGTTDGTPPSGSTTPSGDTGAASSSPSGGSAPAKQTPARSKSSTRASSGAPASSGSSSGSAGGSSAPAEQPWQRVQGAPMQDNGGGGGAQQAPPQGGGGAQNAAEMRELRESYNQLSMRANTAHSGLQSIQQQMASQGLGLRGDPRGGNSHGLPDEGSHGCHDARRRRRGAE